MATIVLSQLSQGISFLREHPKLACVLLLLLSSPIYRILLYFTPLLLSTALCIFALITLTPYVTATDAEVERQSMLGASSQKLKKKIITATTTTTSISKERKLEDVSGYGKSSSSASTAASSASTSLSAASPSSSDSEASWFSWMKGLNDIGRTWMENKLTEQGLALSEPANRETLLTFIEGSFADLLTAQENPSCEIFPAIDNNGDALVVAESVDSMKKSDKALKASTTECVSEGYVLQTSSKDEEVVWGKVSSNGASIEDVRNEEPIVADSQAATITSDVCEVSKEHVQAAANEVKSMQDNSEPLLDDVKVRKQKPVLAHESSSPVMDVISDMPAATIMPKTPSRIPAPSKLLEASRRIFSKEEQSKTLVPRAPLQMSSAARVNQPFKSSFGSTQVKMESSASLFKLPARKFLDRSRSIPGKEGSKLSTSTSEAQGGSKVLQGKIKEGNVSCESALNEDACHVNDGVGDVIGGVRDVNDGVTDVRISDASDFACGAGDNGPRFDEDLEVEEAQALVQSELKMLEVELDEVAAKLPKLDETFAYQRTPVRPNKSAAALLTPTGASIKSNTTLFSASPTLKTS